MIKYLSLFLIFFPITTFAELAEIEGVPHKSIDEVLGDLTEWLVGFGLTLCVLMIIWGGLNYVASTGDEERITKSKKTIHYAVWGVLIIGFSYMIIKVVNDVLI
ncbi:MAG: hypothetical protein WC178_00610 [Candidatus Paceibacterota bacterium]